MSSEAAKGKEPVPYQVLLDENQALKDEVQSLRASMADAEELRRAISEGDLDALVIPGPEGELIFTLDSADQAYRVLVETMNEGTATLTFDGTILYCNRHFAELLRMPPQAIIGTSIYRFIAPENTTTFNALLDNKIGTGEVNLWAEGGKSLPVYLSISSLQAEGSPNAWCLVVTDLTEQKKNEEVLASERLARSIIEQAAETIVVCDTSGRIIRFSNAMPKLCECDPTFHLFEDLINLRFSKGAEAGNSILPVSSALKGSSILGAEATYELEDFQKFHILLNSGPLKNDDGEIIGCVVTLTDTTELKRLEEQTSRQAEELASVMEMAPVAIWIGHDPQNQNITGNRMANEFYEAEIRENVSANVTPVRRFFCKGRELTADELPMQEATLKDIDVRNVELDVMLPSGKRRIMLGSASPLHDAEGNVRGSIGAFSDITERKEGEKALQEVYKAIEAQSEELKVSNEELRVQAKELHEAYEALNESEKRYRLIFDKSMDAILLTDPRGVGIVLSVNPAACRMLGWAEEELIGKGLDLMFDTEDPALSTELDKHMLSGSAISQLNYRRKDGTTLTGEVSNTFFIDRNGEPRTVNIIRDITERKRAEAALREAYEIVQVQSEELHVSNEELRVQSDDLHEANTLLYYNENKFRTLTENSPDLIARFDRQSRCIYANPTIAKFYATPPIVQFYNRSVDELIGKTNSELWIDPELVKCWKGHYENVFATGKPETTEFQYISPQGKKYYFNTQIVPEFVGGKVTYVLVISHDITDMKEVEAKFKEILSTLEEKVKERTSELEEAYDSVLENEIRLNEAQKITHIGSWDWNLVTGELYWSDEMYRIFRLDPIEFGATYDAFLDYVHPDDRDYVYNKFQKTLNGYPINIDYRIILADREERIVHAQGEAIFDERRTPVRTRGTIQDITESKKVEEALAKIEIARKQEIHHRIKNNLQVISSLLDLQAEKFYNREDIKDSEVLKAFKESQDRVISMALIHEELYKSGGIDTLDFSSYIEELAENLFLTYRLRDTDISLNMDLEENIFFDMDTAVPLGIIVNELVSNSLKHAFIGKDKGEIRIKLCREESAEFESSRSVSNNKDFESTSFTLTVSDNGMGIPENLDIEDLDSLGFQLVTSLVDQLDGELELKRNNGTEFTMRFTVTEKKEQVSNI